MSTWLIIQLFHKNNIEGGSTMKELSTLGKISFVLVIVCALNMGLVGIFGYNILATVFGSATCFKTVQVLIGLSAIYLLHFTLKK